MFTQYALHISQIFLSKELEKDIPYPARERAIFGVSFVSSMLTNIMQYRVILYRDMSRVYSIFVQRCKKGRSHIRRC